MLERPISKAGWTRVRFDQIATQINDRVDNPAEAGVERYVGLEHLDPDSLRIRRWGEPTDVESTKLRFQPGDIIFGKRRVYQRKVAVADFEGICSAHAMVLRAKTGAVLSDFLPFFMQSDLFMERALSISVGSLSPTINWKALANEEFLLPPIQEQARVVEALSASATNLDRLYVLHGQAAVLLDALILETIEIRGFSMNQGYKGRFQVEKGERIYHARSGNGEPIPDDAGDTLFFKVADFNRNSDHRKLTHAEVRFSIKSNPGIRVFQPGTVVFPKRGASIFLNKIGILTHPAALDPNLMALEPRAEKVSAEYLMWFYKGIGLWRFADTTSVPQLNHKHLNPVPVPVPSVEQQDEICARISLLADALANAANRLRNAQDAHTRIREGVFSETGVSA
ncbi:MAG: restriction endonuclease subunit S [Rhodobacterales bacterium]|nr:restriction endonuclease subunit S [Rhodobacterales bacterium]